MKVSMNWLNDYIDLKGVKIDDLTNKMILIGNEVDSVTRLCDVSNLVIGHIKAKEKHPQADRLSVCMVDIGEKELKQIVCGAPNVAKGQKVIIAKPCTILPGNVVINKVTIRGVDSEGMICSLAELGIDSKYLSEEDKHGIHVLPKEVKVGEDPIKYLGLDDLVIDFDLTPNRGDLLSMIGMAYEVGAIIDKPIKLPNNKVKEISNSIKKYLTLEVDTDNCPLYIARMVKNIEIKESPAFIKNRLMAAGIRSINNVVDISNYVMLEYGQPLHFFDYDKLGNKIGVRMAQDNEVVTTLDNEKRILDHNDIVITNNDGIIAIAGVMGALNTEVDHNTKTLVIESAIFNPVNVRQTSKKVFRSEASIRFEKGLDYNRTMEAINRACYLLAKYANGKTLKGTLCHNNIKPVTKKIVIDQERIKRVLEMEISVKDIADIFRRLEFDYLQHDTKFTVTVPSRRLDINIAEDLIEEVGRIHGYDHIKGILPTTSIKVGTYSNQYLKRKKIRQKLEALNLKQVITYSLVSKDMINMFTKDKFEYIEIKNPMSEDKKILRYSLLPSLLKVVEYNLARQLKDIYIFEIGAIYYKDNDQYIEEEKITGMMVGNYLTNLWQNKKIEVDFYVVKGILETLFNYLGLTKYIKFNKVINPPREFHPGQVAEILLDDEFIGYIGRIHTSINKLPIYMFEISLAKINQYKIDALEYQEVPKYPSITKDLAFILDKEISAIDIINTIRETGQPLLTNVDIFDLYIGDNIGKNKKSIAFTLEFRALTKTLTEAEIKPIIDNIVNNVEQQYNAKLRDR